MVGSKNVTQRELIWTRCGIFNTLRSVITLHYLLTFNPFSPGSPFTPGGPSGPDRPPSPCENQKVSEKTCHERQAVSKMGDLLPDPLSSLEYLESVKIVNRT